LTRIDDIPANQRSAPLRARVAAGETGARILRSESQPLSAREIELIRACYRVMAKVGAQALSLRQVAREAKVSAGALVYHFGSKDNLLMETMRWALAGTVRRIERELASVTDAREALSELMDAVFVDAKANRDFHLVYLDLVHYAARRPTFGPLSELLREHINGSYAYVIQLGIQSGDFSADLDVETAASHARAIVEGAVLQWLQERDWRETHQPLRDHCHAALVTLLVAE
jgi:AcrR family transcriptional regulator